MNVKFENIAALVSIVFKHGFQEVPGEKNLKHSKNYNMVLIGKQTYKLVEI